MADKTIGQLPVSAGLDDNSLLVTEQGGEARSITGALVKRFAKDSVAEETAKAEQAAKDAATAKASVDASKESIDQSKTSIDQTKADIDSIKTDIDTAKDAIDQAQTDVAKNKTDAEAAAQSAGTSAASSDTNAKKVAAALEEADGIVEDVTQLRTEAVAAARESVKFVAQELTAEQKERARENIGSFYDNGGSPTVKWDGSTADLVSITVNEEPALGYAGETYYLMPRTSNNVPSAASLDALGGSYTYQTGADKMGEAGIVPELSTVSFGAGNGNLDSTSYPGATIVGDMVIVVHEANTPLYNITVEKPGVYFRKYFQSPNFYQTQVTEMTLTGGTLDDGLERLPKKFLPEGVATESYVDEKVGELAPVWLTLTDSKLDRTMNELKTLFRAGRSVKLTYNNTVFDLTNVGVDTTIQGSGENQIIMETPFAVFTNLSAGKSAPSPSVEYIRVSGSSNSYGKVTRTYQVQPVPTSGGTMYGALTLNADPTEAKHAATKQYVDEKATWENLPDKPTIFEGGDTLTWDGDTTGKVSAAGVFYKVSDAVPTSADLTDGVTVNTLIITEPDNLLNTYEIPSNSISDMGSGVLLSSPEMVVFVPAAGVGVDFDGVSFPEAGTYLLSSNGLHVSSLTIPGYTGFVKEVIDPDCLPDETVYVTITANEDNTYSTDMTAPQIISLLESGKKVKAKMIADMAALGSGILVSFYDVSSYMKDTTGAANGRVSFAGIIDWVDVYWRSISVITNEGNTSVSFLQDYLSDPSAS